MKALSLDEVVDLACAVGHRQANFDETVMDSVMVVLLNFGGRFAPVRCVGIEGWTGTKGDLEPRPGIPLCPNGHPLIETGPGKLLAWIDGEPRSVSHG